MNDDRAADEARRNRLLQIAASFDIGGEHAETLADDVLSTFLLHDPGVAGAEERLERLMASACNRHNARAAALKLDPGELAAILPQLPLLTRQALQLHVYNGVNASGIAALLDVSPLYAARLIAEAVKRARREIRKRRERG